MGNACPKSEDKQLWRLSPGSAFPQLDGDPPGISPESGEGGGRLSGEGESRTRGQREGGRHRSESARRAV